MNDGIDFIPSPVAENSDGIDFIPDQPAAINSSEAQSLNPEFRQQLDDAGMSPSEYFAQERQLENYGSPEIDREFNRLRPLGIRSERVSHFINPKPNFSDEDVAAYAAAKTPMQQWGVALKAASEPYTRGASLPAAMVRDMWESGGGGRTPEVETPPPGASRAELLLAQQREELNQAQRGTTVGQLIEGFVANPPDVQLGKVATSLGEGAGLIAREAVENPGAFYFGGGTSGRNIEAYVNEQPLPYDEDTKTRGPVMRAVRGIVPMVADVGVRAAIAAGLSRIGVNPVLSTPTAFALQNEGIDPNTFATMAALGPAGQAGQKLLSGTLARAGVDVSGDAAKEFVSVAGNALGQQAMMTAASAPEFMAASQQQREDMVLSNLAMEVLNWRGYARLGAKGINEAAWRKALWSEAGALDRASFESATDNVDDRGRFPVAMRGTTPEQAGYFADAALSQEPGTTTRNVEGVGAVSVPDRMAPQPYVRPTTIRAGSLAEPPAPGEPLYFGPGFVPTADLGQNPEASAMTRDIMSQRPSVETKYDSPQSKSVFEVTALINNGDGTARTERYLIPESESVSSEKDAALSVKTADVFPVKSIRVGRVDSKSTPPPLPVSPETLPQIEVVDAAKTGGDSNAQEVQRQEGSVTQTGAAKPAPELDTRIETLAAEGKTASEMAADTGLPVDVVREARSRLGIPSMDDPESFLRWMAQRGAASKEDVEQRIAKTDKDSPERKAVLKWVMDQLNPQQPEPARGGMKLSGKLQDTATRAAIKIRGTAKAEQLDFAKQFTDWFMPRSSGGDVDSIVSEAEAFWSQNGFRSTGTSSDQTRTVGLNRENLNRIRRETGKDVPLIGGFAGQAEAAPKTEKPSPKTKIERKLAEVAEPESGSRTSDQTLIVSDVDEFVRRMKKEPVVALPAEQQASLSKMEESSVDAAISEIDAAKDEAVGLIVSMMPKKLKSDLMALKAPKNPADMAARDALLNRLNNWLNEAASSPELLRFAALEQIHSGLRKDTLDQLVRGVVETGKQQPNSRLIKLANSAFMSDRFSSQRPDESTYTKTRTASALEFRPGIVTPPIGRPADVATQAELPSAPKSLKELADSYFASKQDANKRLAEIDAAMNNADEQQRAVLEAERQELVSRRGEGRLNFWGFRTAYNKYVRGLKAEVAKSEKALSKIKNPTVEQLRSHQEVVDELTAATDRGRVLEAFSNAGWRYVRSLSGSALGRLVKQLGLMDRLGLGGFGFTRGIKAREKKAMSGDPNAGQEFTQDVEAAKEEGRRLRTTKAGDYGSFKFAEAERKEDVRDKKLTIEEELSALKGKTKKTRSEQENARISELESFVEKRKAYDRLAADALSRTQPYEVDTEGATESEVNEIAKVRKGKRLPARMAKKVSRKVSEYAKAVEIVKKFGKVGEVKEDKDGNPIVKEPTERGMVATTDIVEQRESIPFDDPTKTPVESTELNKLQRSALSALISKITPEPRGFTGERAKEVGQQLLNERAAAVRELKRRIKATEDLKKFESNPENRSFMDRITADDVELKVRSDLDRTARERKQDSASGKMLDPMRVRYTAEGAVMDRWVRQAAYVDAMERPPKGYIDPVDDIAWNGQTVSGRTEFAKLDRSNFEERAAAWLQDMGDPSNSTLDALVSKVRNLAWWEYNGAKNLRDSLGTKDEEGYREFASDGLHTLFRIEDAWIAHQHAPYSKRAYWAGTLDYLFKAAAANGIDPKKFSSFGQESKTSVDIDALRSEITAEAEKNIDRVIAETEKAMREVPMSEIQPAFRPLFEGDIVPSTENRARILRRKDLSDVLASGSRFSSQSTTHHSKSVSAWHDAETGKVLLLSTYKSGKDDATGKPAVFILDPSKIGSRSIKRKFHTSLGQFLEIKTSDGKPRYTPIDALTLKDPVDMFIQEFESIDSYRAKFRDQVVEAYNADIGKRVAIEGEAYTAGRSADVGRQYEESAGAAEMVESGVSLAGRAKERETLAESAVERRKAEREKEMAGEDYEKPPEPYVEKPTRAEGVQALSDVWRMSGPLKEPMSRDEANTIAKAFEGVVSRKQFNDRWDQYTSAIEEMSASGRKAKAQFSRVTGEKVVIDLANLSKALLKVAFRESEDLVKFGEPREETLDLSRERARDSIWSLIEASRAGNLAVLNKAEAKVGFGEKRSTAPADKEIRAAEDILLSEFGDDLREKPKAPRKIPVEKAWMGRVLATKTPGEVASLMRKIETAQPAERKSRTIPVRGVKSTSVDPDTARLVAERLAASELGEPSIPKSPNPSPSMAGKISATYRRRSEAYAALTRKHPDWTPQYKRAWMSRFESETGRLPEPEDILSQQELEPPAPAPPVTRREPIVWPEQFRGEPTRSGDPSAQEQSLGTLGTMFSAKQASGEGGTLGTFMRALDSAERALSNMQQGLRPGAKGSVSLSVIDIPIEVGKAAISIMRGAISAGVDVASAIKSGAEWMKENHGIELQKASRFLNELINDQLRALSGEVASFGRARIEQLRSATLRHQQRSLTRQQYLAATSKLDELKSYADREAARLGVPNDQWPNPESDTFAEDIARLGVTGMSAANVKSLQSEIAKERGGREYSSKVSERDAANKTIELFRQNNKDGIYDGYIESMREIAAKADARMREIERLKPDHAARGKELAAESAASLEDRAMERAYSMGSVKRAFVDPLKRADRIKEQTAAAGVDDSIRSFNEIADDPNVTVENKRVSAKRVLDALYEFEAIKDKFDQNYESRRATLLNELRSLKDRLANAKINSGSAEVFLDEAFSIMSGKHDSGEQYDRARLEELTRNIEQIKSFASALSREYPNGGALEVLGRFSAGRDVDPAYGDQNAGPLPPWRDNRMGVGEKEWMLINDALSKSPAFRDAVSALIEFADKRLTDLPSTRMDRMRELLSLGTKDAKTAAREILSAMSSDLGGEITANDRLASRFERQIKRIAVELRALEIAKELFDSSSYGDRTIETSENVEFNDAGVVTTGRQSTISTQRTANPEFSTLKRKAGNIIGSFRQMVIEKGIEGGFEKEYRPIKKGGAGVRLRTLDEISLDKSKYSEVKKWWDEADDYVSDARAAEMRFELGESDKTPEELGFDMDTVRGLERAIVEFKPRDFDTGMVFSDQNTDPAWLHRKMQAITFFRSLTATGQMLEGTPLRDVTDWENNITTDLARVRGIISKHSGIIGLRSAALRSHPEIKSLEQWENDVLREVAQYGRSWATRIEVGMYLPISGKTVTEADVALIREMVSLDNDLRENVSERRANSGVITSRGGEVMRRKSVSPGTLSLTRYGSRAVSSDFGRFINDIRDAYKDGSDVPDTVSLVSGEDASGSTNNAVKFWIKNLRFAIRHVLDSEIPASERVMKQEQTMREAEINLARKWQTKEIDIPQNLDELVDQLSRYDVFPQNSGLSARTYVRQQLFSELGQYKKHADDIGKEPETGLKVTSDKEFGASIFNEFTQEATSLMFPSSLYEYGSSGDGGIARSGARAMWETVVNYIGAYERAAQYSKERAIALKDADPVKAQEYADTAEAATRALDSFKRSVKPDNNAGRRGAVGDLFNLWVGGVLTQDAPMTRNVTFSAIPAQRFLMAVGQHGRVMSMANALIGFADRVARMAYGVAVNIPASAVGVPVAAWKTMMSNGGKGFINDFAQNLSEQARNRWSPWRGYESRARELGYGVNDALLSKIIRHWQSVGTASDQIEAASWNTVRSRASRAFKYSVGSALVGMNHAQQLITQINSAHSLRIAHALDAKLDSMARKYYATRSLLGDKFDPESKDFQLKPEEYSSRWTKDERLDNVSRLKTILRESGIQSLEMLLWNRGKEIAEGRAGGGFLNSSQIEGLERAIAKRIDVSDMTNRSIESQSNRSYGMLTKLLGYASWYQTMMPFLFSGSRATSTTSKVMRAAPTLLTMTAMAGAIGLMTQGVTEAEKRYLQGINSNYATILDPQFWSDPKYAAKATLIAMATTEPLLGDMALLAAGITAQNKGFDPASRLAITGALNTYYKLLAGIKTYIDKPEYWDVVLFDFLQTMAPFGKDVLNATSDWYRQYRDYLNTTTALRKVAEAGGISKEYRRSGGAFTYRDTTAMSRKMASAVMAGDWSEFRTQFDRLTKHYTDNGQTYDDAQKSARRDLESMAPLSRAIGKKPTDAEYELVRAGLSDSERRDFDRATANWKTASEMVGGGQSAGRSASTQSQSVGSGGARSSYWPQSSQPAVRSAGYRIPSSSPPAASIPMASRSAGLASYSVPMVRSSASRTIPTSRTMRAVRSVRPVSPAKPVRLPKVSAGRRAGARQSRRIRTYRARKV